ncbi:MAG: hypothetical protein KGH49_02760 [Candidatus Micrarchaeota archaeon]|nr:hypothetical protein [Candidatus Micrarchaeota archaeon]
MAPLNVEKLSPQCYLCSSKKDIAELVKGASKLSKSTDFVQLFDDRAEIVQKLLPAYFNSVVRGNEKVMRSNGIAKEMLIFVAGEPNIAKAISKCGVKSSSRFVMFATSNKMAGAAKPRLGIWAMKKMALRFDLDVAQGVASELL